MARDLGAATGTSNTSARAWGINEPGDVVGVSQSASGVSQAPLWQGAGVVQSTAFLLTLVPKPGTVLLMATGLLAVGGVAMRRLAR